MSLQKYEVRSIPNFTTTTESKIISNSRSLLAKYTKTYGAEKTKEILKKEGLKLHVVLKKEGGKYKGINLLISNKTINEEYFKGKLIVYGGLNTDYSGIFYGSLPKNITGEVKKVNISDKRYELLTEIGNYTRKYNSMINNNNKELNVKRESVKKLKKQPKEEKVNIQELGDNKELVISNGDTKVELNKIELGGRTYFIDEDTLTVYTKGDVNQLAKRLDTKGKTQEVTKNKGRFSELKPILEDIYEFSLEFAKIYQVFLLKEKDLPLKGEGNIFQRMVKTITTDNGRYIMDRVKVYQLLNELNKINTSKRILPKDATYCVGDKGIGIRVPFKIKTKKGSMYPVVYKVGNNYTLDWSNDVTPISKGMNQFIQDPNMENFATDLARLFSQNMEQTLDSYNQLFINS